MNNFSITINTDFLNQLVYMSPLDAMVYVILNGGWIIYVIIIMMMAYDVWLNAIQNSWFAKIKFVILAVDIPKDTEQTPKAVEQLFATISGAHTPIGTRDKYNGMFQLSFAFEIVSIDGYVQFLIRTPEQSRDVVESAIYSQYPDAEITQVEDYITDMPKKFPDEKYNMWGTEVVPVASDVYPIKTYLDFEDKVSGEFKDPMASILETMSKIKPGEQVWIQIMLRPTDAAWTKRSQAEAARIAGKKPKEKKKNIFENAFGSMRSLIELSGGDSIFWPVGDIGGKKTEKKKDDLPSLMLHLTPGEKAKLEAIDNKASKIGFDTKIRLIYLSPKETYSPPRVIASVFGALKQFSSLNLNAFKPDGKTKTKIEWLFVKMRTNWRRSSLIRAYRNRSFIAGHAAFILNTEELASLWHFPSKYIRTPLLQKTESKKVQAPAALPIMQDIGTNEEQAQEELRKQLKTVPEFDVSLDNSYYERNFPVDQNAKPKITPRRSKNSPPDDLPIVHQ